jgi:hypothetical protein
MLALLPASYYILSTSSETVTLCIVANIYLYFKIKKVFLTKWMLQLEQIIEHLYKAKSDENDRDKTAINLGITFNEIWHCS